MSLLIKTHSHLTPSISRKNAYKNLRLPRFKHSVFGCLMLMLGCVFNNIFYDTDTRIQFNAYFGFCCFLSAILYNLLTVFQFLVVADTPNFFSKNLFANLVLP